MSSKDTIYLVIGSEEVNLGPTFGHLITQHDDLLVSQDGRGALGQLHYREVVYRLCRNYSLVLFTVINKIAYFYRRSPRKRRV